MVAVGTAESEWLFEAAPLGLLSVDSAGRVVRANARARCACPEAAPGVEWSAFVADRQRTSGQSGGAAFEFTSARTPDGGQIVAVCPARDALIAEERLDAQAALAGKLAHDLNNILGAILGHASLMKMELEDGAVSAESVEEVLDASRRAKALLARCLAFSRRSLCDLQLHAPAALAREALTVARTFAPLGLELALTIAPEAEGVLLRVDGPQIREVLTELLRNALEAMAGISGSVDVQVDVVGGQGADCDSSASTQRAVRITVRDSGPGVAPAIRRRLFEPFVTTKSGHRSAGLGLAVALGVVRGHGGTLICDSRPGEGATFVVRLPVCESTA